MGYTTKFIGHFNINRELDDEVYLLLINLAKTRRVSRDISAIARKEETSEEVVLEKYGVEGELYFSEQPTQVIENGVYKRLKDKTVLKENTPPYKQPSLWCCWIPTEDRKSIIWNGEGEFYSYVEWINYIIERILAPNGYELNGRMECHGEAPTDVWEIRINDNEVSKIPITKRKRLFGLFK